ncbi:XIAO [Symbiodinium microadriaticum]|nr:XIAO [Symbiodinium microadriaticum]
MKLGMPTEDAQVMVRNPCDLVWQNFQCDGQGQITGLAFMGMASPGQVPAELAQLQHLRYIHLRGNSLSREILRELGELQNLQELWLSHNHLTGELPAGLGRLGELLVLDVSRNRLSGEIPRELGLIQGLRVLDVSGNQLTGAVPQEVCRLQRLRILLLQKNFLQQLPPVIDMPALEVFDASSNSLKGELGLGMLRSVDHLERLDLSHNLLMGSISAFVSAFCALQSVFAGGMLKELRLNHNRLSGEIPSCLLQLRDLEFLTLNDNKLYGALPDITASQLTVLALHRNGLTGVLPESFWALANNFLALMFDELSGSLEAMMPNDRRAVEMNCPKSLKACSAIGSSKLTLHHNRFACAVPESIRGNMLGNGQELLASWISEEELQPFLYYSPRVLESSLLVLAGFLALLFAGILCGRRLMRRLSTEYRSFDLGSRAHVASSSFAVMRSSCCALLLSSPLLLIFCFGGRYYDCSPPLWQTTIASLKAESVFPELGVVACWCAMQLLFRSLILGIRSKAGPAEGLAERGMARAAVWLLWICIVSILSLPSVFFTFAQSVPAQNVWDLDDGTLRLFHATAPVQAVLIDMVLAWPVSTTFSGLTGIRADRLLMTFRLFSAWLLAALTTLAFNENCYGGWKLAWKVCQEGSEEHDKFTWKIFEEEILNTQRDICSFGGAFWLEDGCSRAIVGGLTPFLLKKLLVRSTMQPLILGVLWRFSRLEPLGPEGQWDPAKGRHRKLLGIWPNTTGSLLPLRQMALLTTEMEILIFWSPLSPLLCIAILTAAATNLLMFNLGIDCFGVCLPSDEMNEGAGLSSTYLSLTLWAASFFQLWHSFSAGMAGRFVLLAFTVTVMGPWAKRFLPVRTVKQALWLGPPETGDDRRDDAGREARRGIAFSRRRRMRLCHYAGSVCGPFSHLLTS